jgi:Cu/Ag efflux protein CusF
MKKAIAIIVSLLFVLSVAGLSFAAEKAAAPAAEKKAPVKVKWLHGEVAAVDAAANTITIKGKKAETTITCDDKTKIMMGKKKEALADVKVGEKVSVKYEEVEGKNVAKSVSLQAHAAKHTAKKKAAEETPAPEK